MRVVTLGLTEAQQVEAITIAAGVGAKKARLMLHSESWDSVLIDGARMQGPIVSSTRTSDASSAGWLEIVDVVASVGPAEQVEGSRATIRIANAPRQTVAA